MQRRKFLVAGGAATLTALAGCAGDAAVSDEATNDGQRASNDRAITVSAEGETDGEPDLAVLRLGVEVRADSPTDARSELAAETDAVVTALENEGVPEENITTDRFRIREQIDRRAAERDGIDPRDDIPDEYRFYEGTHRYRVELEAIDRVGEIIEVAVEAGVTDVGRVTFTLSDEKRSELRKEALSEAIETGREEAETIADEVDTTIAEVRFVDASEGQITPVRREVEVADDGPVPEPEPEPEPGTTIEADEVTVTVRVQAQYEIEG